MNDTRLDQAVDDAARIIVNARHVVALVGAGLSVESGVPTFRGPGGMWTKYGEPDMRGYQRLVEDPAKWWEERVARTSTYRELVDALDEAVPNDGHFALRDLEEAGHLQHIITQNIDNLHQIAGSVAITEIHGNRTKVRCMMCNSRYDLDGYSLDELPPRCREPMCNGIVKGDTVMFGEPIPRDALQECIDQTRLCDCMLLVGTSAVVYPAASFPEEVKSSGGTLIEVNPNETPLTDMSDVVLRASAGEALTALVKRLREMVNA